MDIANLDELKRARDVAWVAYNDAEEPNSALWDAYDVAWNTYLAALNLSKQPKENDMDKEVRNLFEMWNSSRCNRAGIRTAMKLRIRSNNTPHPYRNEHKARERHKLRTDRAYYKSERCGNSTTIATFKKVHKDKPNFRPTAPEDFYLFDRLWAMGYCLRDKFIPVLSERQEQDLGWKELSQALRYAISTPLHIPNGMSLLHHAHISVENPRLIAYYPSLKHLTESIYAGDPNLRAVKVTLGKYLTAYRDALGLSEVHVKAIVEKYNGHLAAKVGWKVEFIEHDDPDGWFRVYANKGDFSSCMTGSESVKLYAHDKSVLRLAYIESGDGRSIARCIVRDEGDETGWVRLYGESEDARVFLESWLESNGYPEHVSLYGCLLPLVESGSGGYVCPYIDSGSGNAQQADITTVEGKRYLRICDYGGYDCTSTSGACGDVDEDMCECPDCGEHEPQESMHYVETENNYICSDCLRNNYTSAFHGEFQEYVKSDNTPVWSYRSEYYTQEGLDHYNLFVCEYDDEVHPIADMVDAMGYGSVYEGNATEVDRIDEATQHTRYVLNEDVHTLSDSSTCHRDDEGFYEAEIASELDEERPRMFVIPATATAVQLYAHN